MMPLKRWQRIGQNLHGREYREAVRMADSPGDVKTAEKRLDEVPSFSMPGYATSL